jgi:hypothetical protein
MTHQQLKFGAAKLASTQMNFDLSSIHERKSMLMVTKEGVRGRTTRRFAKMIRC